MKMNNTISVTLSQITQSRHKSLMFIMVPKQRKQLKVNSTKKQYKEVVIISIIMIMVKNNVSNNHNSSYKVAM